MVSEIYSYLSLISILLATVYAMATYRGLHTRRDKALAWFVFFRFVFEVIASYTSFNRINNIPFYYVYELAELWLLLYLLSIFTYARGIKKWVGIMAAFITLFSVIEIISSWPDKINLYSRIMACVFLAVLCFVTAKKQIEHPVFGRRWYTSPGFWLSSGTITYLLFHMLTIWGSQQLMKGIHSSFAREIWIYNSFANVFTNLFYLRGLWLINHRSSMQT